MKNYIDDLYHEYLNENHITGNKDYDYLDDGFTSWLLERSVLSSYYADFLLDILKKENINPKLIVELNKGYTDSIALSIMEKSNYKSYVVSKYSDSINKYYKTKRNIAYDGKLVHINGKSDIYYPDEYNYFFAPNFNSLEEDNKLDMLITQLPLKDKELEPFISSFNCHVNLFLGAYGYNDDRNKQSNIDKLDELYDNIFNMSIKKPKKYYDSSSDIYSYVIKFGNKN